MKKPKRLNPYTRLLDDICHWVQSAQNPETVQMWTYTKAQLKEAWCMVSLTQRVAAAEQLGYEVHLRYVDEGLQVVYVKKVFVPEEWS